MELKEKLKQARSERKISQQALADAIFVSRSAVAKWESGLGVPCNESMEALEKYFGVENGYFMTDKPDEVIVKKNIKMKKRTIILGSVAGVITVALLSLNVTFVICATQPLNFTLSKYRSFYNHIEGESEFKTGDILFDKNGYFSYKPDMFSSYTPHGEWKVDGDYVILNCQDGDIFVLKIEGRYLVWDGERSDCNYDNDGRVFKPSDWYGIFDWIFST